MDQSESSGKAALPEGSSGEGEGKKRKNSCSNCLEFGEGKAKEGEVKKGPCPRHPMKEAPEGDCGKQSRQLSAVNTVVAFSVVSPEIKQAIESVKYIAENMRSRNKAKEVCSHHRISYHSIRWYHKIYSFFGFHLYFIS